MSGRKPLTLEELRKMDGKPVWILRMEDDSGWWAIVRLGNDRANTEYGAYFMLSEYGKTWLAYAYEPTRIDRSAWEPCGACKREEITIHIPAFRAMAVCNQHMDHGAFDLTLHFNFCPDCGRPLTDAAWQMMERRLAGRENQ